MIPPLPPCRPPTAHPRPPAPARLTLALASALLLAACGNGGSTGDETQTLELRPDPARSGSVEQALDDSRTVRPEIAFGFAASPLPNRAPESRAFVTFPLDDLPAGATIESAELVLPIAAVTGNPFSLPRDPVAQCLALGAGLDPSDFDAAPEHGFSWPLARQLMTQPELQQRVNVTTAVRDDFGLGRDATTFRLNWDIPLGSSPSLTEDVRIEIADLAAQPDKPLIEIKIVITIRWPK